jgi:calcium-dependent protein kinase
VHRDYKPENILLESDSTKLKVIDFGIAVNIEPTEVITEAIGTPYYIAPEIWKKHYNRECDIWAIGVVTFILLSGTPPFNAATDDAMKKLIMAGKYEFKPEKVFANISDNCKDLVSKMLEYEPSKRITAEEALHHPWFTEDNSSSVIN